MTHLVAQSRSPRVIECFEYEHVYLDDPGLLLGEQGLRVNSEVDGRAAFVVDFVNGRVRLRATSVVGILPLNDNLVLKIKPRVVVANLTKMAQETAHPTQALKALRQYRNLGTASDWLMDLYAESLLDLVDSIVNRGLYRTYARHVGAGSMPHGRIDFNRSIRQFAARGVNHKVAYEWFERTPDNPTNRCLRAALQAVHQRLLQTDLPKQARRPPPPQRAANSARQGQRSGQRELLRRAAEQLGHFNDVTDDPTLAFLRDPQVTGHQALPESRHYYRTALDLAVLIVKNEGIALEASDDRDVSLPSLLIDMNTLFEAYVRRVLQRRSKERGWAVEILDGNVDGAVPLYVRPPDLPRIQGHELQPLFPGHGANAEPDIVIRLSSGTVAFVAEVKNTGAEKVLPKREEVEQAVIYALSYGLPRTLLVRPHKEGPRGLSYCGRIGSVDVYDFKYDLSADDMDATADEFADCIASFLPPEALRPGS